MFNVAGGDLNVLLVSVHCDSLSRGTICWRHEQEHWFCFVLLNIRIGFHGTMFLLPYHWQFLELQRDG